MGSRIRENVKHLFQCFCEVVGPQPNGKDAWIIQRFPESYKDEEVLKSVPKFAYPCDFENVVQHYSFVLTSVDSKWTFGFCRHDPKSETALVVLSYLPWHESFYKFLNHIAQLTHGPKSDELWTFLEAVYQSAVPDPGGTLKVAFNDEKDRNLTEYYSAVDGHNMMVIFASMLYERRIIFTSKKLYRLSACVQSANAIIYPMNWQHIFIPVLPMALMDYLLAPMPYLIGVPEPILKRVRKSDLGEVVVLDADNNTVETPFLDLESLPQDVVNSLRRQLRNRAALLGDGVSRAFLRALVQLIGGYRDALKFHQGQKITFSQEAFIESRPLPMQPFLRKMLELQIFQQFIEERLDMLNNGLGFSDEFEMEACNYSDKSSSKLKQQYKEWTYTMKKEGSAFFKNVKSKVKERGKDVRSVYKDFRSKFRESHTRTGLDSEADDYNKEKEDKPRSAPTSPTQRRRPHTFSVAKSKAATSFRKEPLKGRKGSATDSSRAKPYSPLSPASDPSSPEAVPHSRSDTPGLQLSPLDMDLMGDLQDVIFRNCSLEDSEEGAESPPVDRTEGERERERERVSEGGTSAGYTREDEIEGVWTGEEKDKSRRERQSEGGPSAGYTREDEIEGVWTGEEKDKSRRERERERDLENFKPSSGASSDTWWSSQTDPLLLSFPHRSRNAAPLSSPPTVLPPKTPTSPPATNGCDLFGATPFVVGSGGGVNGEPVFVVASPSSVDMVRLPPPSQAHSPRTRKPHQDSSATDLIRLDSTPSEEDFDPLSTKEKLVDQSPLPSISETLHSFQNQSQKRTDGLSNPLYPYFHPMVQRASPSRLPNQSFLFQQRNVALDSSITPSVSFGAVSSAVPQKVNSSQSFAGSPFSRPPGNVPSTVRSNNTQDTDLLKEYGLDFNTFVFQNGGALNRQPSPGLHNDRTAAKLADPFENILTLSKENPTQNKSQNHWTKFE
uniref:UDENN domain-containing protein n=1 Tax=Timema douglasi TaxID=61478 RepID=A0A7R8Z5E0_TIMDO|nr:unnamed protein product [Timema douglasi]